MNYHLTSKVIYDTIHAMAALQVMTSGAEGEAVLAPALCREPSALLTVMIKNAFAEVVMRLGPLVTDVSLDDEASSDADCFLTVELITPVGFSTTRHGIIRRALEQTVALTALYMWCVGSEHEESATAASLAKSFATVADQWYSTLTTALTPALYPTVRI